MCQLQTEGRTHPLTSPETPTRLGDKLEGPSLPDRGLETVLRGTVREGDPSRTPPETPTQFTRNVKVPPSR